MRTCRGLRTARPVVAPPSLPLRSCPTTLGRDLPDLHAEAWFEFMTLSVAVPTVALLTWAQLRRRSAEAGAAADAMLVPIALGQVFLMLAQ